jgi:acetyltransferase-like isoleucine patch superfamily enzyme
MGWNISNNVKIGFSYIDGEKIILNDNVSIGHFNIIRRLKLLELGKNSYIMNFNQIFFSGDKNTSTLGAGKLILGENVHFISHHFIDTEGSITIGNYCTIAGRDTHFWSHGFIPNCNKSVAYIELTRNSIEIGDYVYIGARSTLLGCSIPDKAIVGAGSVVNKSFDSENCRLLIAGNPATIKKRYYDINNKEKITT